MPTADRLASPEPREPFSFRMPLAPADSLDRSPVLTEEERRGIASLLQLAPSRYLEFDRQVRKPEPSDPTADGCAGSVPAMASKEPGVLPLTVVDNSTITPIHLTVPTNAPYDQEAFTFAHFKRRGLYDLSSLLVRARRLPSPFAGVALASWLAPSSIFPLSRCIQA